MSSSLGSALPLFTIKVSEQGRVKDIKGIIVRVDGLPSCLNGQLVDFGRGVRGIIMGFDEKDVLVLILGDHAKVRLGQDVSAVSEPFTIPVGEAFIGRMANALGEVGDDRGEILAEAKSPVFKEAASITERAPVNEFLHTGTKAVDILIPIGKGQRQLLIGDRMTGKTVVALDAILTQRDTGVLCIYCCIGKGFSAMEKVMTLLSEREALAYTIVLAALDSSPPGEQYLVPFSSASMAEYFAERGRDVLVVFDDLTKHAWAYRQLSLLLERPPGREAYPGDIFYVQTQLMERAGKLNEESGGGSITFLGIAETLQGDMTAYIPSNLISMCDGQVFFSTALFGSGIRPAIDSNMSVSIIGGRTHPPILRKLGSTLRLELLQYTELTKISTIQSNLSEDAEKVLKRGQAITSILRQDQYKPISFQELVLLLYALHKGLLDDIPESERTGFRTSIHTFAQEKDAHLLRRITPAVELTPEIEQGLDRVLDVYFRAASG